MALTVGTSIKKGVFGDLQYNIVPITWDNSYTTGGKSLTPADVGFKADIFGAVVVGVPAAQTTSIAVSYDRTNSKLQAFYGDNNNAADGALIEVANTGDISATVVNVLFLGK